MPGKITSDPIICDRCLEFEQQIARVFESEKALQESGMWDGEDRITGDPYTDIAVWVGKTNADRGKMSDWWFCCPAHPNCSHEYLNTDPGSVPFEDPEPYNPEEDEELKRIQDQYEENFRKNRILNKLDRERARNLTKSTLADGGIYRSGVWEEHTCAHGNCNHTITEDDDWLHNYINWRLIR
jgi:hypothetical protein